MAISICSVNDCKSPCVGRGWCRKHYYRWKRTGTTDLIDRKNYCTVDGCESQVEGMGLCSKHRQRLRRHNDPSVRLKQRDSGGDFIRWMHKVEVQSPGCWIWTGSKDEGNYGIYNAKGYSRHAYRAIYQILVGPIPKGMHLDHLCRVHECVNPDHLEPVTPQVNCFRGSYGRGKMRPAPKTFKANPDSKYIAIMVLNPEYSA